MLRSGGGGGASRGGGGGGGGGDGWWCCWRAVTGGSRLQTAVLFVAALALLAFVSGFVLLISRQSMTGRPGGVGGTPRDGSASASLPASASELQAVCGAATNALRDRYESELAQLRARLVDAQAQIATLARGAAPIPQVLPPIHLPLPDQQPLPQPPLPGVPPAPQLLVPSTVASNPSHAPQIAAAHLNRMHPPPESIRASHATNAVALDTAPPGIPVLLFCFNRPDALRQTLDSIFQHMPHATPAPVPLLSPPTMGGAGFPVFVSQDGDHPGVTDMIDRYRERVYPLRFQYQPSAQAQRDGRFIVYYRIAAHYKFALSYIFDTLQYDRVILLEDDMRLAPDFFAYFNALSPLFDTDPSLYCISGWNDNGQDRFVRDPTALHRTDCFPGLGWMMSRRLWHDELAAKWHDGFWDDWLRLPPQRGNRTCIYPEINRVYTFGRDGSSSGQFFDDFLKSIKLNDVTVDWYALTGANAATATAMVTGGGRNSGNSFGIGDGSSFGAALAASPLRYLDNSHHAYDDHLAQLLSAARGLSGWNDVLALPPAPPLPAYVPGGSAVVPANGGGSVVALNYHDLNDLTPLLAQIGLMTDHKDGVPRTSYRGVVDFRYNGHRVLLRPHNWAKLFLEPQA